MWIHAKMATFERENCFRRRTFRYNFFLVYSTNDSNDFPSSVNSDKGVCRKYFLLYSSYRPYENCIIHGFLKQIKQNEKDKFPTFFFYGNL